MGRCLRTKQRIPPLSQNSTGLFEKTLRLNRFSGAYWHLKMESRFNDPFAKLTRNQLEELSYVVRVRAVDLLKKQISADGVDASEVRGTFSGN